MSFLEQHKDYLTYQSEDYYVKEYPDRFDEEIEGFLFSLSNNEANKIKYLINLIAQIILTPPTQNWGYNYLISDLREYSFKLYKSNFHNMFDLFERLLEDDVTTTDKINSFLSNNKIGYICELGLMGIDWLLASDNIISKTEKLNGAIVETRDICKQAFDCLQKAKDNLNLNKTDRDRKDAIFNCLSAMESLLKSITNDKDIDAATKTLKNNKNYGKNKIIKDGQSIFNFIHHEYPDIRHGNPQISTLSEDECLYWINRINTFITYICSIYKKK